MWNWLKKIYKRIKEEIGAFLIALGTGTLLFMVPAVGGPPIDLEFHSATETILFEGSDILPANSYAYNAETDAYYVHWSDGYEISYPGDEFDPKNKDRIDYYWNEATGQEDTRIFKNQGNLKEVLISGKEYRAKYKDPTTGQIEPGVDIFTKEQYDNKELRPKKQKTSWVRRALAALVMEDVSWTNDGSWSTSITLSHDVSGSDTALACITTLNATAVPSITTITYAGTDMASSTNVHNSANKAVEAFTLIAPTTGTNDVVASSAGHNDRGVHCITASGADQTTQPICGASYEGYPAASTDFSTGGCSTETAGDYLLESYLGQGSSDTHTIVTSWVTTDYEDVAGTFSMYGGTRGASTTAGSQITTWQNSASFSGTAIVVVALNEAVIVAAGDPSATTTINYGRIDINNGRVHINNPN